MILYRGFDAAAPPATAPPGCDFVLGYIGGDRADRIWTLEEWQRFSHLVQFPAYVPDTSAENPAQAAVTACVQARALGWAPFQADRRVIVYDLETEVVPGWYQRCAAETEHQGFTAVAYGSESTIAANFAAQVWLAAWDGNPVLLPGQTVYAHQYQAGVAFEGTQVDYSVMSQWLYDRGGQGPRHG